MDYLSKNFIENYDEYIATDLIKLCRCQNFYNLGVVISKYMEEQFPYNTNIKEETGVLLYYTKQYEQSYLCFNKILKFRGLDQTLSEKILFNQHFCIDSVKNMYVYYNRNIVNKIIEKKNDNCNNRITLTITSCKRFDLFQKTINSFLNCCKDLHLIDNWFCVDDNSSSEDKEKMCKLYPFFTFYFKNAEEKGHPQSMNIIKKYVKSPYIFHMEDDWQFFQISDYISKCLEVLGQNALIGQCLINKNYGETADDHDIKGGYFNSTNSGLRYYIHEHTKNEEEVVKFKNKYGNMKNCSYWPHFSFRPSLLRRKIYQELGNFNENISHFEMDYSYKYVNKGYISAFLEGIYCIHIGRLTSERNDIDKVNAYVLNNESQFSGKESCKIPIIKKIPFKLKTFVVNLDRRPDRWEEFEKNDNVKFLNYERFSAVDGSKLKPTVQLQQIFEHNDYNMREGMVGCALSHIKLCVQLMNDAADVYLILEDDIDYVPEFEIKLKYCCSELIKTNWDMFYLGHHIWQNFIDNEVFSKTLCPKVEQFSRSESLKRSMGGTIGYMITKRGAGKLLDFINITGMTNGIDTVQQKSADILNIYYSYPHLIYSECYRGNNNPDSDIQYNYKSLSMKLSERLRLELEYYKDNIEKIDDLDLVKQRIIQSETNFYYESENEQQIIEFVNMCKYPTYTLEDKVMFVVPNGNSDKYFHRFKKSNEWNIDDVFVEYNIDDF